MSYEYELASYDYDQWYKNECRREAAYSRRVGEFDRAIAYDALAESFPQRSADWDMYIREYSPLTHPNHTC